MTATENRGRPDRGSVRRRLVIDITPLRESPDYRRLWTGHAIAILGTQMTRVAVPYQVYVLTDSTLMVGLASLAQLLPLMACSLFGGSVADAVDRRKLLLVTEGLLAAVVGGLALLALLDRPPIWAIFVLVAITAGLSALDSPARSASVAGLVRRQILPSAFALNQTLTQVGAIVGPAIAGVIIATLGLSMTYGLNVLSFALSVAVLSRMRPMPPAHAVTRPGLQSVIEGLRYLRSKRAVMGCFLADLNAMFFGMPRALFPAIALDQLGGDAVTVGLLHAAPGAGALIGALTSGWVSSVTRQGRAVIISIIVWGLAIAGFGLSHWLPLTIALLMVAGVADVVSAVFRQTVLQLSVPDHLRGRLSAVHIGVVTGGPLLGDARAGVTASVTSPAFAMVSGGLASAVIMAFLGWRLTALRRWTLADADAAGADADVGADAGRRVGRA
ncbi:MFS transporter [Solwaraspora sp. WMMD1047]|uniref:MFS transporter n=1 Tax=Solwaraspora sp. WMMD1047 TaxID=3016102 RepID=UPI002417691A|nr:MFS transporter [Solwaraspora sp. WMMD1047]MDG4828291.1 MFS transporter [Solwaraspora sp. WMMD1047]